LSNKIFSLTDKIWNVQSEIVARDVESALEILVANRNIEDFESFINTSTENTVPDPFVFVDMEKAANRIVTAIKNKQKIAILGDYDVDGATSVSIFMKFFKHIGAEYTYYIPDRMSEGYGLSTSSIEKHKDYLIIAVDCGSASLAELKYAADNNIDVIVIDHHRMSVIPENAVVVNPHRPDEDGRYKYLCAAGLVFLCVTGIHRLLKNANFYDGCREPDLGDYLDLVALATVCDVVELKALNRAFVSAGIKIIRQRKNFGISALLSLLKSSEINAETIAFFLGPKLNAAGRMASADLSVDLLTTEDPARAKKIAMRLDLLNKDRQILEREMMEKADSFVDEDLNFICVFDPEWHVGVTGIIAGRLREKYNRPSMVITVDSKGIGKGSCRSTENVNISDVIRRGIERGVILSGGGHAAAAGFSTDPSKINDLIEFLKSDITHKPGFPELYADCVVSIECLSPNFIKRISVLEPFGMGNRYPKFIISNVKIVGAGIVGENHLKFSLLDEKGNSVRGISFRSLDTPLGDILLNKKEAVDVLGTATISSWNGLVNFQLDDIRLHGKGFTLGV
jgi:single-stranded-DNA-specific exonuclease